MEDGDKDGFSLTPEDHRFIEALGLHFEKQAGFPRIGGRILGLLMLSPKPLALGSIAELLMVSPASVSTNMRQFHMRGLVEEISYPGDRRHYYAFRDSAWDHQFEEAIKGLTELLQIMGSRMNRLGLDENVRQQRFAATVEFFEFFLGMIKSGRERWHSRAREPLKPTPSEPSRSVSSPSPSPLSEDIPS